MMAHLVAENPQWQDLEARFPSWADLALKMVPDNSIRVVQLLPFGVIKAIFPNEGANKLAQDLDTFALPSRQRPLDIAASRNLTVTGPVNLVQGYTGILLQAPIFISGVGPGELFGQSKGATNCSICAFNSTYQDKFWGFVQAVTDFRFILHNLAPLEQVMLHCNLALTNLRLGLNSGSSQARGHFNLGKPSKDTDTIDEASVAAVARHATNALSSAGNCLPMLSAKLGHATNSHPSQGPYQYNYKELLLTILPERLFDQVTRTRSFLDKSNHWTGHYLTARAPANIILDMMSDFLEGKQPSVKDIMVRPAQITWHVPAPKPLTLSLHCSGTLSVDHYKTVFCLCGVPMLMAYTRAWSPTTYIIA
ncbi:hypothetical protein QJQ45_006857 [Haematococcus lacustris]|nr:hypothetical protein QJQ45_006857 [Haematococcus lacustris]